MRITETFRCAWLNLASRRSWWITVISVVTLAIAAGISVAAFGLIAGKHRLENDRLARDPLGRSIIVGDSIATLGHFTPDFVDEMRDAVEATGGDGSLIGAYPFVAGSASTVYPSRDATVGFQPLGRTAAFLKGSSDPIFTGLPEETREHLDEYDVILSREFADLTGLGALVPGDVVRMGIDGRRFDVRVADFVDADSLQSYAYVLSESVYFSRLSEGDVVLPGVTVTVLRPDLLLQRDPQVLENVQRFRTRERLLVQAVRDEAATFKMARADGAEGYSAAVWREKIETFLRTLAGSQDAVPDYVCEELRVRSVPVIGPHDLVCFTFAETGDLEAGLSGIRRFPSVRDYINKSAVDTKIAFDRELEDSLNLAIAICAGVGVVLALNVTAFQFLRFKNQSAEIGLLRAMGFSAWNVLAISATEALLIWAVGASLAAAIGFGLGSATAYVTYENEPFPLNGFASIEVFFVIYATVVVAALVAYLASLSIAAVRFVAVDPGKLLTES